MGFNPNEYIIKEDYIEMIIESNKHGVFRVKIDKDDYDRVSMYRWSINALQNKHKNKFPLYYAVNKNVGLLHRFILNAENDVVVDHINRDSTDNRKNNLRECTRQQNNMNRAGNSTSSNKYKGVTWYPYRGINKWFAHITIDGKFKSLGYFDDIEDAIKARNDAEIETFGEYARKEVSQIN